MSDGQTLLLLLALLYLSDCFIWVRKQSVAFVSTWGSRWRVALLNSSLGNASGGLLFMNPLPPLGGVFLSHLSPISISPAGICAFNLQALPSVGRAVQTGQSLSFTGITGADTDGAYLLVNGERFAKCATARQATGIAKLINATAHASASERESMVRSHLAKQFTADEAAAVLQEANLLIKPVRWVCSILLIFLFLATPILVSIVGLIPLLIPIAVVMVVLAVQISFLFQRVHRRLYPLESPERIENVIKMVLCPPVSIRATDLLTKHLLSEYSPVVVAELLLGGAAQPFVRAFILDLQHPLKHEVADKTAAEIISWAANEQLRICLEHVERSNGAKPETLLAPPERDGNSISYCPRCGCQFLVSGGACPDCPGVGLLAFANQGEIKTGGAL